MSDLRKTSGTRLVRRLRGSSAALALIAAAAVACGGKSSGSKSNTPTPPAVTPDAGRVLVSAISIAWSLETIEETADNPARTRVSIAITNETGSTSHEEVGLFDGACKQDKAEATSEDVLLALRCQEPNRGAVLHMVKRPSGLVFLRAHVFPGETELSFDVLKTFPLPAGAVVKVGD